MAFSQEFNEIQQLIKLAEERAKNIQKKISLMNPVVENVRNILENLEIDAQDYTYTVSNFEMQHALNKHCKDTFPLVPKDFALVPHVIKNYDFVRYCGKTKSGLKIIKYTKRYELYIHCLFEIRNGKKELALKTMYKNKKAY